LARLATKVAKSRLSPRRGRRHSLRARIDSCDQSRCVESCTLRDADSPQYTSFDFTQALADHDVLGSLGSTGDAYDNAMAESFVDSFKTELIRDRVWKTRTQLELAVVEWVGWYNHDRLHSALDHIPPTEFEALYARQDASSPSLMKSGDSK
jgi:transposase InsO family protein